MNKERLVAFIKAARLTADDDTALTGIDLYPKWVVGIAVTKDSRYQYEGKLYKCVQAHTTQADWQPNVTPALWTVVSLEEWPEWVQPTGAHDAYAKGDKVTHSSKKWTSDVDANTWEPGVYGWTEVTE